MQWKKKTDKDMLEKQNHREILIIDEVIKSQIQREEETNFPNTLEIMYAESEPVPLQIDISSLGEDIEANATEWVHANILNLSQLFGVDLKGCRRGRTCFIDET